MIYFLLQVFKETEYKKTVSIPIINDNQFENDVTFYIVLKNAEGGAGIGDPSVAMVTIVDDDGKGACMVLDVVALVCFSGGRQKGKVK